MIKQSCKCAIFELDTGDRYRVWFPGLSIDKRDPVKFEFGFYPEFDYPIEHTQMIRDYGRRVMYDTN